MRRILGSAILLLGLAATQTIASADENEKETPGLEGVWLTQTTVTNCQGTVLRHVRNLEMYIHDGSVSAAGGTVPGAPTPLPRTNAVGTWRHLQAHTFTATFRFFGLNPDGTLASMATAVRTIQLTGDQFSGSDGLTIVDLNGNLLTSGCATTTAVRLPAQ